MFSLLLNIILIDIHKHPVQISCTIFPAQLIMAEVSSKSSENVDVEALGEKLSEQDAVIVNPREDLPTWKWVLTLLGLYLGAMLYG